MTTWRGRTRDGTFAVHLPASVLDALSRYCCDAGSVETGGILIGSYSNDLAVALVSEATPPPADSKRGRSWFVRGVRGLSETLSKRWKAKQRTFYIGEWHFHPANHIEPSSDDFAQMIRISRAREYQCEEPVLLIMGASKHDVGGRPFRAFVCPRGDVPVEFLAEEGSKDEP